MLAHRLEKPMKATCLLFPFLALQINAADPPELLKARQNYQAATERALTPVKAAYWKELDRLISEYSKAGKLDDALAVKNEQAKLVNAPSSVVTSPEIEKMRNHFVERTFVTPGGTYFTFNKDGTGQKKWQGGNDTFTWEIVDAKYVKIQGPDKAHFFWFESRFKGEIADAVDATRRPISVQQ
jgi:hypothetical protein